MSLKLELCSSTEWLTLRGYIDYDGDDLDHEEAVAFRRRWHFAGGASLDRREIT